MRITTTDAIAIAIAVAAAVSTYFLDDGQRPVPIPMRTLEPIHIRMVPDGHGGLKAVRVQEAPGPDQLLLGIVEMHNSGRSIDMTSDGWKVVDEKEHGYDFRSWTHETPLVDGVGKRLELKVKGLRKNTDPAKPTETSK